MEQILFRASNIPRNRSVRFHAQRRNEVTNG
jgi:hypothetical protein